MFVHYNVFDTGFENAGMIFSFKIINTSLTVNMTILKQVV